jgi:DnaJ-class molecular chaperone
MESYYICHSISSIRCIYSSGKQYVVYILYTIIKAYHDFKIQNFENVEREDNCYKVLNLNRYASVSDIKKSFKKMSLELHPDKNKSEEAVHRFHLVKQAKEILSDVDMRSIYDRFGIHGVKVSSVGDIIFIPLYI